MLELSSSLRGTRSAGSPRNLLVCVMFRWAQPERDMCRLHRLLYDGQQVFAQLVQVHFVMQGGTESCHRLGGVILAAIEAPVNDPLDATAQGLEESSNDEGRDHHSDSVILVEYPLEQ